MDFFFPQAIKLLARPSSSLYTNSPNVVEVRGRVKEKKKKKDQKNIGVCITLQ